MAKRTKHYVYIIPDYQWKDGSIGKIGVTQNPERRAKEYKLDSLTILEEHTNAKVASKREIELQKQYGFKIDTREYWKALKMGKKALTTEAQKKRVANTNYKTRNFDYKIKVANTNYKTIVANTDYKARSTKIDYKTIAETNKKPINQYDLQGNFIKQWSSATDASIGLFQSKKNQGNITICCQGKLKTAYKFIWKYAN